MIDQSQTIYYFAFALVCIALGIVYVRSKSLEGTVITTKEFQQFQQGFLTGYSLILFCEFIATASFYHSFLSLHLTLEQLTKLYLATVISTTLSSILLEVIDIGSRRDKCILSAGMYSVAMFSVFFGGHFEMLLMGRLLYGMAAAIQQTSFESYALYEHSSRGFPEDWLSHTFTSLTHLLALLAALSGIAGQGVASLGYLGPIALCCILFALAALYILVVWEKDVSSPRFMLSGFLFNSNLAVSQLRTNRLLAALVSISILAESSIIIFTFYWAPWLDSIRREEDESSLPFEMIFSVFLVASMLGNYAFSIYTAAASTSATAAGATTPSWQASTPEQLLQAVLVVSSVCFFLGAVFQTPLFAFLVSVLVQLAVGVYWPCIGYYRGRIVPPELRSMILVIQKVGTVLMSMILLSSIHHSPLLMLTACAALYGGAAYLQNTYLDGKALSALVIEDEEDDNEL